jgi:hypothetical protein
MTNEQLKGLIEAFRPPPSYVMYAVAVAIMTVTAMAGYLLAGGSL